MSCFCTRAQLGPAHSGLRVIGSRPQREPIYFLSPWRPTGSTGSASRTYRRYSSANSNFHQSAVEWRAREPRATLRSTPFNLSACLIIRTS
jgi:hypothetical protein